MVTKACKQCRTLFEGAKCPACGGEGVDSFKGHVEVLDPVNSEIAKNLVLTKKGSFAIRLR
jgi:RNA polymerase subunit RPABC4/transcription elongation factor Spt4